jgi:HemY protein
LLRAIRWAVEDRDLEAASHWLSQLPQGAARRTQALRLKLRVARLAQDNPMALETARLLAKHRAFSPVASRSIVRGLVLASLEGAHDVAQVRAVWQALDISDRRDPDVVLAAVARLQKVAADGADAAAMAALARDWLTPVWDAWNDLASRSRLALVKVLHTRLEGLDAAWLARLENTQREHPADPLLQYLAAQAFFQQKLWGKSGLLFQQAARSLSDPVLRVHAWCRLAELAREKADANAELEAWRQAAREGLREESTD